MILHLLARTISSSRGGTKSSLVSIGMTLAGIAAIVAFLSLGEVRLAVTVVVVSILIALARIDIRWSIVATFGFLTILGDVRRWLIPVDGWSGADPLLLVGATVAVVLWVAASASKKVRFDTPLSRWMLILMAIMAVQIFNPVQGNLMVGITGAIFLLVPLLWYWVGKAYGSEALLETLFFRSIVPLAVLAALFGLYQVFYGYPEYQLEWYRRVAESYAALGPSEDMLRPLAVFPNISEYNNYLGAALIALIALVLRKRSSPLTLGLIVLLFGAMFLSGTRGPIVKVFFVGAVLWTILGQTKAVWLPRLAVAVVIAGLGLVYGLSSVGQIEMNERAQFNMQRQAALMPGDGGGTGTVGIHLNLARIGIVRSSRQPLGYGLGYTTIAARRFGDGGFTTEKDITDMFISLGVPGGLVYLIVLGYTVMIAIRHWGRSRNVAAMIVVGLLIFMGMGWLRAGSYVMTPLVWFCVGMLDSMAKESNDK